MSMTLPLPQPRLSTLLRPMLWSRAYGTLLSGMPARSVVSRWWRENLCRGGREDAGISSITSVSWTSSRGCMS
eukprot:15374652-Alexandrium_andersonii.AAC.1